LQKQEEGAGPGGGPQGGVMLKMKYSLWKGTGKSGRGLGGGDDALREDQRKRRKARGQRYASRKTVRAQYLVGAKTGRRQCEKYKVRTRGKKVDLGFKAARGKKDGKYPCNTMGVVKRDPRLAGKRERQWQSKKNQPGVGALPLWGWKRQFFKGLQIQKGIHSSGGCQKIILG